MRTAVSLEQHERPAELLPCILGVPAHPGHLAGQFPQRRLIEPLPGECGGLLEIALGLGRSSQRGGALACLREH